jgi:hypothetical protein
VAGRAIWWDNSQVEHRVEGVGDVPRRALGPVAFDPESGLLLPAFMDYKAIGTAIVGGFDTAGSAIKGGFITAGNAIVGGFDAAGNAFFVAFTQYIAPPFDTVSGRSGSINHCRSVGHQIDALPCL